MGNARSYNYLEGVSRVAKAAESLDVTWIEVLATHAALEHEIDRVLETDLPRAKKVITGPPTFTFAPKIAVLDATWTAGPADADLVCLVLLRFNELRNAVAHPNPRDIKARRGKLVDAYRKLNPKQTEVPSLIEIAQGVCTFLADGPFPNELSSMFGKLSELVEAMSAATEVRGAFDSSTVVGFKPD